MVLLRLDQPHLEQHINIQLQVQLLLVQILTLMLALLRTGEANLFIMKSSISKVSIKDRLCWALVVIETLVVIEGKATQNHGPRKNKFL
jgi:hypothetical protein